MDIAQRIAQAAADSGVCERFIHVSCLGASSDAPSRRLQTKVLSRPSSTCSAAPARRSYS